MQQNEDIEALKDFKESFQRYKTANIPDVNWRLHALLKRLGLTKYEVQAYISLVESGQEENVTQIVKNTGIPHPRAYDTLHNLVKYGLISPKIQMTNVKSKVGNKQKRIAKTYIAFSPEIGIENLFSFFKFAKNEAIVELNALTRSNTELESGNWEVHGRDNIINIIKIMLKEVKYEILISATVPFIQKLKKYLVDISKKKVNISCVSNFGEGTDTDFILEGLEYVRFRGRKNFPMPYIVIDRNRAIQWNFNAFNPLQSGDPQFTQAQVIDKVDLIDTIIDHFFFLNWRLGKQVNSTQKIQMPCTLIHSVSFVEIIEKLLNDNKKPQIAVKGTFIHTGEHTLKVGEVTRIYKNWETGTFAIFIETDTGDLSFGGYAAEYEDIAAHQVTISL